MTVWLMYLSTCFIFTYLFIYIYLFVHLFILIIFAFSIIFFHHMQHMFISYVQKKKKKKCIKQIASFDLTIFALKQHTHAV